MMGTIRVKKLRGVFIWAALPSFVSQRYSFGTEGELRCVAFYCLFRFSVCSPAASHYETRTRNKRIRIAQISKSVI